VQNHPTTGVIQQSTTSGPITIDVSAPSAVFQGNSIPIYFEFHNTGSGKVDGDALDISYSGDGLSCSKTHVNLISGTDGYLKCSATTSGDQPTVNFRFTVGTSYTYRFTTSNSVTVLAQTS
jgi:hypothetical protein